MKFSDFNSGYTVQTDWEEEARKIKWLWPYIAADDLERSIYSALGIDPKYVLDFVIPFEYRKKTKEEVDSELNYNSLLYFDLMPKEIFYQAHYSNGRSVVRSCTVANFVSKFKPQKE